MLHDDLTLLVALRVEADFQVCLPVVPGGAHRLVRRALPNFEAFLAQPFAAVLLVPKGLEEPGDRSVDCTAYANLIAIRSLMFVSQAAFLLIRDCYHMRPPGTNVMFVVKVFDDFLVSHFLGTGSVENRKPLFPDLSGFCFDGFVAHARAYFGRWHTLNLRVNGAS